MQLSNFLTSPKSKIWMLINSKKIEAIFLLPIVLLTLSGCSKNDQPVDSFLKDFLEENGYEQSTLTCLDRIDSFSISEVSSVLARDTIREFGSSKIIVLSATEKAQIIRALKLPLDTTNLTSLKNIKIMTSNEVEAIFKGRDRDWDYFNKKYQLSLCNMSNPLFLRDNSLCVFYFSYTCGPLCGEGNLTVFKKTWWGWSPYLTIYEWVS